MICYFIKDIILKLCVNWSKFLKRNFIIVVLINFTDCIKLNKMDLITKNSGEMSGNSKGQKAPVVAEKVFKFLLST